MKDKVKSKMTDKRLCSYVKRRDQKVLNDTGERGLP